MPRPAPSARSPPGRTRQPRVVRATAAGVAAPVAFFLFSALPARPAQAESALAAGEGWVRDATTGADRGFEWTPDFPEPDERHEGRWSAGGVTAHEFVYHYDRQEQGRELAGGTSRIAPRRVLGLDRPLWIAGQDRWVREAVIREGEDGLVLVWYWYEVGGTATIWAPMTKVFELWGFLRRRPDATLIAYATLCRSELCGDEREAFRTLIPPP